MLFNCLNMKKIILFLILSICFNISPQVFAAGEKGKIIVNIKTFRNERGEVLAALFNSGGARYFPKNPQKYALKGLVGKIKDKKAQVVFEGIPFGEYALSALHDENSNKKMDFNWFHKPIEGYGFSNNARAKFSAPSFDAAKFKFESDELVLNIELSY